MVSLCHCSCCFWWSKRCLESLHAMKVSHDNDRSRYSTYGLMLLGPFKAWRVFGDHSSIAQCNILTQNKFTHVLHSYFSRTEMSPSCWEWACSWEQRWQNNNNNFLKCPNFQKQGNKEEQEKRKSSAFQIVAKILKNHRQPMNSSLEPSFHGRSN